MPSIDTSSTQYAEQARYEAAELERQRAQESHQAAINDLKEDFEADKKSTKEEYDEKLVQERKEAADEVRRLKEEMYNSEGKKFSKDTRDVSDQKALLASYHDQLKKEYEDRTKRMEESMSSRLKSAEERKEQQIEENMKAMNESHKLEAKHLSDALKQATVDPRDLDKERAVARAQSIREVEGQANRERDYLIGSYETSIQKMRENDVQTKSDYQKRMTEHQYEMMGKANQMLREQKKDFIKRDQGRLSEMNQIRDEFHRDLTNEQMKNQRAIEVLHDHHQKQTNHALQNQAGALKNYYDGKDENLRYQLEESQKEAQLLKTSDNAMLASPALVNKIHKNEEERYLKQLEAEHNYSKNQIEGLQDRDVKERRELADHYTKGVMEAHKQSTRKLDQEKALLLNSYEDLKYSKDSENQNLKDRHHASIEKSHIRNAQEIELLQRRNIESMNEQRESLEGVNRKQLEDAKFENKVQSREAMSKMTAQRREYEKKMNEMALNHEMQTNELRLEFDTKLREQERNFNRLQEDRVRGYEYRLKEQELASKDRERSLTEHYEEEIAKMKRTNARLIQKKS